MFESTSIIEYVNNVFEENENILRYFYTQLYKEYNPDINGYNLVFMLPPDLSGWKNTNFSLYSQDDSLSYFYSTSNFLTFAAVDFTPPINQINTERVSSRTGAIPYATEITNTEQCSMSYVENSEIDIYHYHHMWLEYIRAVLDGVISPDSKYYDSKNESVFEFGAIDYATSAYIVRYKPDMKKILFIGKCIGIFPQSLPSKELIGQRTSNELTTLPFSYFCSAYREVTWRETSHWLINEFQTLVKNRF